jgi:hypothetical protein
MRVITIFKVTDHFSFDAFSNPFFLIFFSLYFMVASLFNFEMIFFVIVTWRSGVTDFFLRILMILTSLDNKPWRDSTFSNNLLFYSGLVFVLRLF